MYTPTGTLGIDTLTASLECDSGGTTYAAEANLTMTFYDVTTTVATDCLSTVNSPAPRVATANVCVADVNQFLITETRDTKLCIHFKNNNKVDGCPMRIIGMLVAIYDALGLTLDASTGAKIKKIEGGVVSGVPDCSTDNRVNLLEDRCKSPKAIPNNNESWGFTDHDSCTVPALEVGPQEYFHIPNMEFADKFPRDRPMDITIYFECNGDCNTGMVDYATFRVRTPS